MVGSFGKKNMDLLEKSIGKTVLVKFVFYRQMATITGRLREVSQFNHVFLDMVEIFSIVENKRRPLSKQEAKRMVEEMTIAGKKKIQFVENNSAIRKISAVETEEREIKEKKESKEAKVEREELVAKMISKIENKLELSEKEGTLLKSIIENKNGQERLLTLKEETLYFNPWVPKTFLCLKSVDQIRRFKKILWGEEIAKSGAEEKEVVDKFTKFWYE